MTLLVVFIVYAICLSIALARYGLRSTVAPRPVEAAPPNLTRVLIVGATGGTGRQLVSQALERGMTVTVLVRNPSKFHVVHQRLTVVKGNVLDAGSLEAAMSGQEAVVSALGHKRFLYPTRILSEGTSNILKGMEAHRVRRLVCETSLGLGDSAGRLGLYFTFFIIPLILPWYFWDKTRQERAIAASGVEWVIVRPAMLTNGTRRAVLRHGRHIGSFLLTRRISRADVAGFMLDQLASDVYLRTAPGVA